MFDVKKFESELEPELLELWNDLKQEALKKPSKVAEIFTLMRKKVTNCFALTNPDNGKEINDPKPLFINTGLNRELTLDERIANILARRIYRDHSDQIGESPEESQDFNVPDDLHAHHEDTLYQMAADTGIELQSMMDDDLRPHEEPPEPSGPTSKPDAEGADPDPVQPEVTPANRSEAEGGA